MQDGGFCYDMWQMRHLSGSFRRVLAAVLALAVQMASAEIDFASLLFSTDVA